MGIDSFNHRVRIANCDFSGITAPILDGSLIPTIYTGYVKGLTDIPSTIGFSANLSFPRMPQGGVVTVTGSGTVTAVSGLYAGQYGSIKSSGSLTFAVGPSIGTGIVTNPDTLISFWFDGTTIWLG